MILLVWSARRPFHPRAARRARLACSGSLGGTTAWRADAAQGRRPSTSAEARLMTRLSYRSTAVAAGGWTGRAVELSLLATALAARPTQLVIDVSSLESAYVG